MAKRKKKVTFNKELAKSQKLSYRIPTAPPTEWHIDKSKYNRKRDRVVS